MKMQEWAASGIATSCRNLRLAEVKPRSKSFDGFKRLIRLRMGNIAAVRKKIGVSDGPKTLW